MMMNMGCLSTVPNLMRLVESMPRTNAIHFATRFADMKYVHPTLSIISTDSVMLTFAIHRLQGKIRCIPPPLLSERKGHYRVGRQRVCGQDEGGDGEAVVGFGSCCCWMHDVCMVGDFWQSLLYAFIRSALAAIPSLRLHGFRYVYAIVYPGQPLAHSFPDSGPIKSYGQVSGWALHMYSVEH